MQLLLNMYGLRFLIVLIVLIVLMVWIAWIAWIDFYLQTNIVNSH